MTRPTRPTYGWSIDNGLKYTDRGTWKDRAWAGRFSRVGDARPTIPHRLQRRGDDGDADHRNHAGDWYYKHTNTGATCDGPVSGTSKDLTGLTANTSYTYSAYSDSSCSTCWRRRRRSRRRPRWATWAKPRMAKAKTLPNSPGRQLDSAREPTAAATATERDARVPHAK